MNGGDRGPKKGLLERLLPKEAQQLISCFKPQPSDVEELPSSVPKSPASASQQMPRASTLKNVEAALSPRQRKHLLERARFAKMVVRSKVQDSYRRYSCRFWVILMSTAVLSSLLSYSIDQATWSMGVMRHRFTTLGNYDELLLVIVFNLACVILARLLVRTTAEAEGSGFPEVKAMLFGKVMPSYLSVRVLVVKAIALALGVGAGLPLGKEGPNVHMAACISRRLGPGFYEKKAGQQRAVAGTHLLLAACAVGVGSSFSAPIGGVVFSLELVLPQVFDYIGYTGCFLSAVTGSVCFAFYRTWTAGATGLLPLMSTDVQPNEGVMSQYPVAIFTLDVFIGVVCGLAGGLWIRLHAKVVGAMKRWRLKSKVTGTSAAVQQQAVRKISYKLERDLLDGGGSPRAATPTEKAKIKARHMTASFVSCRCCEWRDIFQIAVVVVINTVIAAGLPLLGGRPQPALLSHLFDKDLIHSQHEWSLPELGPHWTMFLCFLFKWTITIFALSLPNPAGVVAPTMIIGGLLGRCIGLAMPPMLVEKLLLTPGETEVSDDTRGAFMARLAILGAAAFCAAVCRAFAMAITVFEVLALPNALLPLCASSLAAMFVANKIALPYFDTNLVGRGLGGISALTHTKKAQDPIFTVMRRVDTRLDCLDEKTTLSQVQRLLQQTDEDHVPIVQHVLRHWADEGVTCVLKGSISRNDLATLNDQFRGKPPSFEIDLLDSSITFPENGKESLVQCAPTTVDPGSLVQDVYLIMKITRVQVVYVTQDNCLLGVVNFKELLGHRLDD